MAPRSARGAGKASAATTAAPALPALRWLVAPTDVPAHLAVPQPNPSPDHAQAHITAAKWQAIIKDRWDGSREAKGKSSCSSPAYRVSRSRLRCAEEL
jgi:hypothetical protein